MQINILPLMPVGQAFFPGKYRICSFTGCLDTIYCIRGYYVSGPWWDDKHL